MWKLVIALFAATTFSAVGAGTASAATPLDPGGPLAGNIPPSQGGLSCTRYLNKRVTIMPLNCEMSCAVDFAAAAARGLGFDYDYCRSTWTYSCRNQYQRALGKLDQGTCMNCLDDPARQGLYPLYEAAVQVAKDQIYCDNNLNNTPFPDGHGFVSQQRDVVKCQNKIMRSLIKSTRCLNIRCHQKITELMYWNKPIRQTFAQCETDDVVKSCKARFQQSVLKAGSSCPPCLDANAIWASFQTALDTNNGNIYCTDQ